MFVCHPLLKYFGEVRNGPAGFGDVIVALRRYSACFDHGTVPRCFQIEL